MDGPAAQPDRISALPDELLHVILSFLGDALAVTRTSALSRRWRRVWVHAMSLSFYEAHLRNNTTVPGRFARFVDWALAQRGDADMDSLSIWISEECRTSPAGQVNEWLRYAARRVVRSLDVHLSASTDHLRAPTDRQAVELPSHGRTTSISLYLSKHRLQLPTATAARYEALTVLRLSDPSFGEEVPGGAGNNLGDFVTSCCPRLRRLVITQAEQLLHLVLRSDVLEELEIFGAWDLQTLGVTASDLRVLSLNPTFHDPMRLDGDEDIVTRVARITAPRLQEIDIEHLPPIRRRLDLDVRDLTNVRRVKIRLAMHGKYCHDNEVGLLPLLTRCPGVEHVDVTLRHWVADFLDKDEIFDLTKEGVAAQFANVRSMVVRVTCFPAAHLVASTSSLLMCCPLLGSLFIRIFDKTQGWWTKCFCDDLTDKWKIPRKIALEMLEDAIITGFTGADEEMQLVSLLFESSNSIKCMALSKAPQKVDYISSLTQKVGEEVDGNMTSKIGQKLIKVPCADRGRWYFVEQVFIWKRQMY